MTLQHRRLSVTNLAHDLHRALAVRTERHLRPRKERNDPQGPLASTALGGRSHDDATIGDGTSSCTESAVNAAAAHPATRRRRWLTPAGDSLFCQRRKDRTPARKWPIVPTGFSGLGRRLVGELTRRSTAEPRVRATDQAVDCQVAGRRHRPREVRTVHHDREQDRSPHEPRLHRSVTPRRVAAPPAMRGPNGPVRYPPSPRTGRRSG